MAVDHFYNNLISNAVDVAAAEPEWTGLKHKIYTEEKVDVMEKTWEELNKEYNGHKNFFHVIDLL